MVDNRVLDYAVAHGLSNKQAKKHVRANRESRVGSMAPARGGPIAGTGKPKGPGH